MSPIIASVFLLVEAAVALGILIATPTAMGYGVWRALRPGSRN